MSGEREEAARLLLARGVSIETIAQGTGLGRARLRRIAHEAIAHEAIAPAESAPAPTPAVPATAPATAPAAPASAEPEPAERPKEDRRVLLFDLTARMCRWPIGHPGDEDFRFCGAHTEAGQSYCAAHRARAYRKRVTRESDGSDGGLHGDLWRLFRGHVLGMAAAARRAAAMGGVL